MYRVGFFVFINCFLKHAVAFAILSVLFLSVSCERSASTGRGCWQQSADTTNTATRTLSVEQAIADVRAYTPPASVTNDAGFDPLVFERLRAELVRQLESQKNRITSAAPQGDEGRVTDLTYNPETRTLNWSYVNVGDYDSSGEVGIADITMIAQYYLANTTDGIGDDALEMWLDGDSSGSVDIADITQIAYGYMNTVSAYRIVTSESIDGDFTAIGSDIPFLNTGVSPVVFDSPIPANPERFLAVVSVGTEQDTGDHSNILEIPADLIHTSSMFGRNPQRTHLSPYAGPDTAALKWAFQTSEPVYSSPAIATDGTVYIGCFDNNLYAIESDGKLKWTYPTGDSIYSSPAIGADGTVFVGSFDNNLYAVNPDGTLKWSYPTGSSIYSSPAIANDGTVYVASFDHSLYAIESDGTLKWSYPTGDIIDGSPALGVDGTIYIGSYDSNVYAVNPDGSTKWVYPTGNGVGSSPAVGADGTIYIGKRLNDLQAINPDGTPRWAFHYSWTVVSSPAIGADGAIYFGTSDGKLHAVNPDSSSRWVCPTSGKGTPEKSEPENMGIYSSPVIDVNGTIYIGSYNTKIYAVDSDGEFKWSYPTNNSIHSSPAIAADGTLYVGSLDGHLYAFGPGGQAPDIASVTPVTGAAGTLVHYRTEVAYPGEYLWNFGGGATPNLSNEPFPSVVLGAAGTYNASVTVTNEFGSDTFDFEVVISSSTNEPEIVSIEGTKDGDYIYCYAGCPFEISAVVTGTPEILYDWNFKGSATPTTSLDAAPTITPNAYGNYICTLTVYNEYGQDTSDFILYIQDPPD